MSKVAFTAGRVSAFRCPLEKKQAFLWDSTAPGLGLRATPKGKPAYVFQGVYGGKDIRITIGSPDVWRIPDAQAKAREFQRLIDEGKDPREQKRAALAAAQVVREEAEANSVTVGDLWPTYLQHGRPKRKDAWKPRYLEDIRKMAEAGGEKKKRGQGLTRPGPLFPLMQLSLVNLNEDLLKDWYDKEAVSGRHQAMRALMIFRGFLRWSAAQPKYRDLVDRDVGKAPAILESLPSTVRRTDALEASQVQGWWGGVERLGNRSASAYLIALLLTGARREEMATLRWECVDFRWGKMTIADKVDDVRTIPLTPYLAHLLMSLPKVGVYVFASASKSGRITDARASHTQALRFAGIEHLTFHGLRRSFSLLGEGAGAPSGAIAQIMGHKPSATAEGYRPRSIDTLRPFAERIESHILDLANVRFDPAITPGKLRAVN